MSHLLARKGSKSWIAAIVCAGLNATSGVFLLIASITMLFAAVSGLDEQLRMGALIAALTSIVVTAQIGYMLFAVIRATVTLRHIGIAWIAYMVAGVISRLGGYYLTNIKYNSVLTSDVFDVAALVPNVLILLLSGAIGVVFLLYDSGRLSDKRIVVTLSGAAFLITVINSVITGFSTYGGMGMSMIKLAAYASMVVIAAGSSAVTYGIAFFTGLSLIEQ